MITGAGEEPGASPGGGSSPPALHVRGLSKAFLGTQALADFSIDIAPGQVHVLVGQNGSGKSTLIKVLSGFHQPTNECTAEIGGEPLRFGDPDHSRRLGCRFVHQDLALVDSLSVADNLLLSGGFPTVMATISERAASAEAARALARVDASFAADRIVSTLTASERSQVAIARALRDDPRYPARLLVLDEPTAALPSDEVDRLLSALRLVAGSGTAVLYVTHHLDEVYRIGDSITVLRDGRVVHSSPVADVSRPQLVEHLVGGEQPARLAREAEPSRRAAEADPVLTVTGLRAGSVASATLGVRSGQIVGVTGLTGSGREALLSAVFGATQAERGEVRVAGVPVAGGPAASIASGIAYLPADRKRHGGVMTLTALENASLPSLGRFTRMLAIDARSEREAVTSMFGTVGVRPANAEQAPLQNFSGGNQQKVLFAKWRLTSPRVFLLDEPTQGVDVGAKSVLHRQLFQLARDGCAVLMSSTDVEELADTCDRVLIMRRGRVGSELSGPDVTVANINRELVTEQ